MSVSGNSSNIVHALKWCRAHNVSSIAFVEGERGRVVTVADKVTAVDSTHYGMVEDVHTNVCHMPGHAFIEVFESGPGQDARK